MRRTLPIWYVGGPALAMLLVLPLIRELPPLRLTETFDVVLMLMALPFWLGAAAAPGYLYAWTGRYEKHSASRGTRAWVSLSLIVALLASLGGLISIAIVIPFPFAVVSVIASTSMVWRFVVAPHGPPSGPPAAMK